MQCPDCAHLESIRYGTSRGVRCYRCQACRRTFQTMRKGRDPTLKEQAQKLYLEELRLRAICRNLGIHHKTVSRWLVQAAAQLPVDQPKTKASSFIEVDELCTIIARKILNVGSG